MLRTPRLSSTSFLLLVGLFLGTSSFAQEGTLYERSFVHNDSLRTYLVYVPAAYDGQDAWPLVIDYHGFAIDAAFQKSVDRMDRAADVAGFLVVYPVGSSLRIHMAVVAHWAVAQDVGGTLMGLRRRTTTSISPAN